MEIIPPDCCTETLTPCSENDWVQCAVCGRMVCPIHDELITVLYSGEKPTGADEVCSSCIKALFENGELVMGEEWQYIIRR
jgi:hypothetical protein